MKQIFILVFTILSFSSSAQDLSKSIDSMRRQLNKNMASYDSARKEADSLMLINNSRFDSVERVRYMEQNTRNLVSFIKERDRKQKQAMWTRLGFGMLMLGVLIFGLLRKRKKKGIQ